MSPSGSGDLPRQSFRNILGRSFRLEKGVAGRCHPLQRLGASWVTPQTCLAAQRRTAWRERDQSGARPLLPQEKGNGRTPTGCWEAASARRRLAGCSAGVRTPGAGPEPGRGVSGRLPHGPGRGCRRVRRRGGRRRGSAGTRWGGFPSAGGTSDRRSIRAPETPRWQRAFRPGRRGRRPRLSSRRRIGRRPGRHGSRGAGRCGAWCGFWRARRRS